MNFSWFRSQAALSGERKASRDHFKRESSSQAASVIALAGLPRATSPGVCQKLNNSFFTVNGKIDE